MTRSEFIGCMGYLATALNIPFPQDAHEPTPERALAVYLDLLGDLPLERLMVACRIVALSPREFRQHKFPTPGEIRQALADSSRGEQPDGFAAWGIVRRAIEDYGYIREAEALASMPPLVRLAVEDIGWLSLCDALRVDEMANRAHFAKCFDRHAERAERQILLAPATRDAALPGQNGRAALPGQVSGLLANIGRDAMPPVVDNTKKKR